MESLGRVTAPLDALFKAIGDRLGGPDGIKGFIGAGSDTLSERAKSSLVSSFKPEDTSGTGQVLGVLKSGFILVANILLVVLQIATAGLKAILGLVT